MDTRLLTRFAAAVEHGSLNRAAKALNITQPALTKSIQQLEATFAAPLLERGVRGVVPTEFGKVVAARARLVQVELETIAAEIDGLRGLRRGKVRIGVPAGIGFLSRVMCRATLSLVEEGNRVGLDMTIGSRRQLLPALRGGEFDFVVTVLAEDGAATDLVEEPLFVDRDVIVVARSHVLARRRKVSFADLARHRWVALSESGALADELAARAGPEAADALVRSSSSLFVRILLREGDFVGIISRDAVSLEIAAGDFVELAIDRHELAAQAPRVLGFVYRSDLSLSSASRALMRHIRRIGADEKAMIPFQHV
jgi:DNA-binding transcriptional LysR family regulator